MRRSTGFSSVLTLIRAGSAAAAFAALAVACSDSTSPKAAVMPDGVSYIRVDGSDSAKQAFLQANPIVVSSAPAPSADVLVTPSPALSSSVASFHYTLSHPAFAPEAIPTTIVPQTS